MGAHQESADFTQPECSVCGPSEKCGEDPTEEMSVLQNTQVSGWLTVRSAEFKDIRDL